MEFRILGLMEVLDGARRVELPRRRGRSLLAILTLHAGRPVASDRLMDELWGEKPPTTAATVVHGLVSRLRKVLEPGRSAGTRPQVLQTVGTAYRLAIDPYDVDANRFKWLLDEALGSSPEMRSAKLSAALSLWRGPALADFIYEPFAQRPLPHSRNRGSRRSRIGSKLSWHPAVTPSSSPNSTRSPQHILSGRGSKASLWLRCTVRAGRRNPSTCIAKRAPYSSRRWGSSPAPNSESSRRPSCDRIRRSSNGGHANMGCA